MTKVSIVCLALFLSFYSNCCFATILKKRSMNLVSQEGIEIVFNYEISVFTPYDWKWSSLTMLGSHGATVRHNSLDQDDKVRIVLVNTCLNGEGVVCKDKAVEVDLEWNREQQAFTYQHSKIRYVDNVALWLRVSGYWDAYYKSELAIVINGQWLVDPINQTSNFLLQM